MPAHVQSAEDGERLRAGPTTTVVKVPADVTDGRLGMVEIRADADWSGPPPHVHAVVDHVWWVLDGELHIGVAGSDHVVGPGTAAFVPAGTSHSFGTGPTSAAVFLQIDTPRALDGYFRELTRAFPPGRAVDPTVVADIMRRHDTTPVTV